MTILARNFSGYKHHEMRRFQVPERLRLVAEELGLQMLPQRNPPPRTDALTAYVERVGSFDTVPSHSALHSTALNNTVVAPVVVCS